MMTAMKRGLGLTCVLAALVGCSSTATQEPMEDASVVDTAPVTTTGTGSNNGLNSNDQMVEEKLDTVFYFDFDQSLLRPEARAALAAHAERLKAWPKNVRLEGHGDERGTREYNMALGERRANTVRDFLMLQGVDGALMETVSYGEERPAMMGTGDRAWAQNRRVEMK